MNTWEHDGHFSSYDRWVLRDEDGDMLLMMFHNHNPAYRDEGGYAEWSWAEPLTHGERPIPDTALTMEERQAYVIAAWRMS